MNATEMIGVLMSGLLAVIGYNGQRLINRMDRFEKKIQDLIITNVTDKRDIEELRRDVDNHDVRISNLEH
tara:strand:- start:8 stop:217 length:210 start_codon:yes stop_codon:yes gene_type:complete